MNKVTISLKAARVNKEYSQGQAAALLNISVPTLVSYEKGRTSPNWNLAKEMARIYDMPLDMLNFNLHKCSAKSVKGE